MRGCKKSPNEKWVKFFHSFFVQKRAENMNISTLYAMSKNNHSIINYTPKQLKLPIEIKIYEINNDWKRKEEKYINVQYRAVNFKHDDEGNLIWLNKRKFKLEYIQPVKENKYRRTEKVFKCEDCNNCKYKKDCCTKAKNNRTIRINSKLT